MKKLFILLSVILWTNALFAENENVKFGYDAGVDVVSSWLWRGCYNGGLSVQPYVDLGFDSEPVSFRAGVWASIGADNWHFNTLTPEVDFFGSISLYNTVTLGFTYYGYIGREGLDDTGTFGVGKYRFLTPSSGDENYLGAQMEVSAGFDLEATCGVPFGFNCYIIPEIKGGGWSSLVDLYLEAQYRQDFKNNMSLTYNIGAGVGIGRCDGNDIDDGNISAYSHSGRQFTFVPNLRFDKTWELNKCNIDLYTIGMINTSDFIDGTPHSQLGHSLYRGLGLAVGCNLSF